MQNRFEAEGNQTAQTESKGSGRPSNRFRSTTMCSEFDHRRGRTERNNCWYSFGSINKLMID